MKEITAGGMVARILAARGVRHVFGIPDGTYLALLGGLRSEGIELITPRHESTAVHMAGAYARLTGGLGVCIASNGPGVANALSGIAVENAEGNRVLALTSSRRTPISAPDRGGTYQYLDHVAVIRGMSKWSASATSADRVAELAERAVRESSIGRPGVVHLDIPENVVNGSGGVPANWKAVSRPIPVLTPDSRAVEEAADILTSAAFPFIHAGSGTLAAAVGEELGELSQILHAPVLTSWGGRGVLPETHPLVWPMIHVKACASVRSTADVALCLGSRLGETDYWGKPPYWAPSSRQKLIRVDVDPHILGLNRTPDLPILADAGPFLRALLQALKERSQAIPLDKRRRLLEPLLQEKASHRAELDEKLQDTSSPMCSAHLAPACGDVFDQDAVYVFDGGNTSVWGQFYHQVRSPLSVLSTPHFGHLGAGAGQALGAAVARPGKQVVCITGDGAFGFHPQELETAVRHQLPVVFLVAVDRQWGMVKISQQFALRPLKTVIKKTLSPEETYSTELGEVAWDRVAEAMGAHGERVSDPSELRGALERCLGSGRCSVVHAEVDRVKHMWAPGLQDFKKMHQEPRG